jgi:RNA polymerase sigma factor (sigma-70 family)
MSKSLGRYGFDPDGEYFRVMGSLSTTLDDEKQAVLSQRILDNNDEKAKRELIEAHLGLLLLFAKKYGRSKLPISDLAQEAYKGMVRAAEDFDFGKGCFSTYAGWWINHYIRRYIADNSRTVRLPVYKSDMMKRIRRLQADNISHFGEKLTIEELAGALEEKVETINEALEHNKQVCFSLDKEIKEDGDTYYEITPDEKAVIPDCKLEEFQFKKSVWELLDTLKPREKQIIARRYGLDDDEPQTFAEIGACIKLTSERIRQIEKLVLMQLRNTIEADSQSPLNNREL